ncbi:MAG: DUF86 domain-containing protein [Aeromicrobium sp.]|uniref:HepT-like ribonuclease domain-containing protein n=1 Tax=Aeromicrobium sp. TaxID=1871063 RepID=UPI0039E2FE8E
MSKRTDAQRVAESLTHLDALHRHLSRHDLPDSTVADAVSMRLSAAIEALQHDHPSLGQRLFGEQWRQIWGTRNYIAHGYAFIDFATIADTVKNNLPEFERVLREELEHLGKDS